MALIVAGCRREQAGPRVEPIYDRVTGRLTLLKYDSTGKGRVDTWSEMDGARILRIAIDTNGDGKADRWEYYAANQRLEKVGFSLAGDGQEDAWSFPDADGALARIEISTRRNGSINRVEYYEKDVLVRAEEDSDGDSRIDKWETYDGPRLASVAFDTMHRGTPDRRLVYAFDGAARMETEAERGNMLSPVPAESGRNRRRSRLE